MRYVQHVPGLQVNVFGQIARSEQLFHIEELRFKHTIRSWMKQHHLRMLGAVVKASSDRYRLCDRERTAEIVLARLSHLAGGNEVGLLEILQGDRDDWVVQNLRVRNLQGRVSSGTVYPST